MQCNNNNNSDNTIIIGTANSFKKRNGNNLKSELTKHYIIIFVLLLFKNDFEWFLSIVPYIDVFVMHCTQFYYKTTRRKKETNS